MPDNLPPLADAIATTASPAQALAEFTAALTYDAVPERVRERAKPLILDALGLASNAYNFAKAAVAGATALANGILIHGLDFDDNHLASTVHPTAAALLRR